MAFLSESTLVALLIEFADESKDLKFAKGLFSAVVADCNPNKTEVSFLCFMGEALVLLIKDGW